MPMNEIDQQYDATASQETVELFENESGSIKGKGKIFGNILFVLQGKKTGKNRQEKSKKSCRFFWVVNSPLMKYV